MIDPVMVGTAGARYELARKFIDAARDNRQRIACIFASGEGVFNIGDVVEPELNFCGSKKKWLQLSRNSSIL